MTASENRELQAGSQKSKPEREKSKKQYASYSSAVLEGYLEKLREYYRSMPDYAVDYIQNIRSNIRLSTTLAYADDIYDFLRYLCEVNPTLQGKKPSEIPLSAMDQLDFHDMDEYMIEKSHYEVLHRNHKTEIRETKPTRKARIQSSLRAFFTFLHTHRYIRSNPTEGMKKVRLQKDKMIDRLDLEQTRKLLDTVRNTELSNPKARSRSEHTQYRDTAILTLLINTGIRVSELVGLNLRDVDFESREIVVIRKGGKPDNVFFNDETAAALFDYVKLERPNYAEPDEDALFLSTRRERMAVRSIQAMLKKYGREAIPLKKTLSPHKLRKTYGTLLYEHTGDIRLVADVLGHTDIAVTSRHYVDTSLRRKADAGHMNLFDEEP